MSNGVVFLKGYIHSSTIAAPHTKGKVVEISYNNVFTGKTDYYFSDLDSLDRFTLEFPLHYAQMVNVAINEKRIGTFMA